MHSGVCASAEVKRWHDEVTFLPCKHNTAPLRLSQAACVCVCVCVSYEASSWCSLARCCWCCSPVLDCVLPVLVANCPIAWPVSFNGKRPTLKAIAC